jgi:predicted metalloprotease with PDZ domain
MNIKLSAMKKKLLLTAFALILFTAVNAQSAKLVYTVNVKDSGDDRFRVTLEVAGLDQMNDVYQFASTAPGTYQTMNIGRFVHDFKAYTKKGKEVAVTKLGENQYQLSDPKKVKKITYTISETWDTPVDKNVIYKMCGTSIEKDHVLINGQCVFGYPKGMQSEPLEIKLEYPSEWLVGTALAKTKTGNYYADNYDKIVDSPILLGRLTKATTTVGGAPVEIYTYSKTDLIKSENLLASMSEMLKSAEAFVVKLPVDRYTFLFHFENESWGAWEHSYSSEYVFEEQPYSEEYGKLITSTAAHEFFHVITPLNIHSELIENFDFVTPTASEHLWLYEGTTEWASDFMQLRYGLMDLNTLFSELKQKLDADSHYDPSCSLSKLSLTSFSDEGQKQYGNIYMRGALVAGLLDIRLLELSNGKKGLREVVLELSKKYGPKNSFPEKDMFQIFTQMTYPEIADFFNKYVQNATELPIAEYYAKLGIKYTPEIKTGRKTRYLGMGFSVPDGKIRFSSLDEQLKTYGLMVGDELLAINGTAVSLQNGQEVIMKLSQQPIDTEYDVKVKRGTEEVNVKCKILSKEEVLEHVFEIDSASTEKQIALRNAWLKNL